MKRIWPGMALVVSVAFVVLSQVASARSTTITLSPGDTLRVNCSTGLGGSASGTASTITCAAAPTPTPVATAIPTTGPVNNVGVCGESNDMWHAPVINGCATGHEHGDAPPAWVTASQWMPMFTHPGNTPGENVTKHTSFKGFAVRLNGLDLYVVAHLDTNPSGHVSRFHSYQMWARDGSNAVSHWDGWLDFNDDNSTGPQIARHGCEDTGIRPAFLANDRACNTPLQFESWYPRPAGYNGTALWAPDFGFNMSSNYWLGGNPDDRSTWPAYETGTGNGTRRIEVAWYASRSSQRGAFWATNFGETVGGPNDPLCGTTKTVGAKTYPVVCIQQYIAPSMPTLAFPGNAIQKSFPMTGVVNPN